MEQKRRVSPDPVDLHTTRIFRSPAVNSCTVCIGHENEATSPSSNDSFIDNCAAKVTPQLRNIRQTKAIVDLACIGNHMGSNSCCTSNIKANGDRSIFPQHYQATGSGAFTREIAQPIGARFLHLPFCAAADPRRKARHAEEIHCPIYCPILFRLCRLRTVNRPHHQRTPLARPSF